MGKRSFKKRKGGHGNPGKKVKKQWKTTIIPQENTLFHDYYFSQLKLSAPEFQLFWAAMKQKLPVVFRINPNFANYHAFCDKVRDENLIKNLIEGEKVEEMNENQPKEIPKIQTINWYPGDIVFTLNTSKQMFKKSKILSEFHNYLQRSFDSGLISRQELVSMLPPLYLNINSDDIILDMCAAPGSKTSQILEMMYGDKRWLAKGCVIANDADYSRAQMLIHQLHRSGTAGMAVINHDGQFLPEMISHKIGSVKCKFQFDKILCDVPCSGDGATRKLPIKWASWHTSDGMVLHPLQLSILMKGVNLLKKGGYLVYSTCSLNPIENEAVINALFEKVNCGLELIDIHPMFGVKGRRGLHQWSVLTIGDTMKKEKSQNQAENNEKELKVNIDYESSKKNKKIKPTMFAPSKIQAEKIHLDYTMRILPHDQNSGGFFVALLKKHDNFQWKYPVSKSEKKQEQQKQEEEQFVQQNQPQVDEEAIEKEKEEEEEEEVEVKEVQSEQENDIEEQIEQKVQIKEQQLPKKKVKGSKYEKFVNIEEEQFKILQQFFGLKEQLKNLLYVKEDINARRRVFLVSEGVRKFILADQQNKIKLVNMGCQVFQKGKESFAGHQCLYRLCQQGIHFLMDYINLRKIKVPLSFFKKAILIHSLAHDNIEEQQVKEMMKGMSQGSFCIYIEQEINGHLVRDGLVGQNFKSSFHIMVSKEDCASFSMRYL